VGCSVCWKSLSSILSQLVSVVEKEILILVVLQHPVPSRDGTVVLRWLVSLTIVLVETFAVEGLLWDKVLVSFQD
jgi:hypothetical protein